MTSLKFKEVLCILYSSVLFISGAILVGFSVVLLYKIYSYLRFVPSNTIGPFIMIFLLGFIHIMATWLALRGPSKEHDFHIIMFMAITVMLILVEFSEGVWSLVIRGQIGTQSEMLLNNTLSTLIANNGSIQDSNSKQWAVLESHLHCCGTVGVNSYDARATIPYSCYNGTVKEREALDPHFRGCTQVFIPYAKHIMLKISLAGFLPALFQILGVYVFYSFYVALKNERKKRAETRPSGGHRASQPSTTNTNTNTNNVPISAPSRH